MAVFTENCLRDGSKFGASVSCRVSIFLSLQPWAELGLGPMATCLARCPAGIFLSASPQLSGPLPCFSQALLYHSSQFFFHPLSQFWAGRRSRVQARGRGCPWSRHWEPLPMQSANPRCAGSSWCPATSGLDAAGETAGPRWRVSAPGWHI